MTRRLSELTPEQQERQRELVRQYKVQTVERRRARHKERYATEPKYRAYKDEIARRSRLKTWYGLTDAGIAAMLAAQGGRCAICRTDKPGGRGWHVDHDHATDKVRELLCTACNVFVGRIEKRPAVHAAALEYIRKHASCT